jgi:hypothetical protein
VAVSWELEKYYWLVTDGWFVLREKYCWLVKDRLGDQRGENEWELIKILLEWDEFPSKTNSVGHPKSHAPHATFRLPKPRSH